MRRSLFLAALLVLVPASAHAESALEQLVGGSASPTPAPSSAAIAPPGATPTPSGPYFDSFEHHDASDNDATVSLSVHGVVPGGREPTYVWAASAGRLSAQDGEDVTWQGPTGQRAEPLVVPVTVTVTDGRTTGSGTLTVTVGKDGRAHVTAVSLPGLHGSPEDFEGGDKP